MALRDEYRKNADQTYGGNPVEPLKALEKSTSVLGFGDPTLTAHLGLKLNMASTEPTGPRNSFGFNLNN